ncbi:unnamed protein product [Mytilus edulis]|uniref:Uncharacterized protein n=1 Tax=Mytilus edulis TaxID=6550 RepID=A0A8S3RYK7_MYTED|nr:unnamed protein product [Mytilus edulis]
MQNPTPCMSTLLNMQNPTPCMSIPIEYAESHAMYVDSYWNIQNPRHVCRLLLEYAESHAMHVDSLNMQNPTPCMSTPVGICRIPRLVCRFLLKYAEYTPCISIPIEYAESSTPCMSTPIEYAEFHAMYVDSYWEYAESLHVFRFLLNMQNPTPCMSTQSQLEYAMYESY